MGAWNDKHMSFNLSAMRMTPRSFGVPRLRRREQPKSGIAISPLCWGVSESRGWGVQLEPERILREIASLGETAIEAGPSGFLPDRSVAARSLLKHHRLKVVAGPVRAVLHHHDLRGAELAHIDGHAAWLAALGAQTLVLTVIGSRTDGDPDVKLSSTGWAHLLSAIGSVQHVCTNRRLRLAVQPRHATMIQGPADIERLLVGSEASVCVDVGHLVIAGADPIEVVELAAGRIAHVHVSDVDRALAGEVRSRSLDYATAVGRGLFKPIGAGDAGVAEVVEAVRRAGYRGWYGLESEARLDTAQEDPLENVKESLERVREMLPLVQARAGRR
jgi:inosose dehydratase